MENTNTYEIKHYLLDFTEEELNTAECVARWQYEHLVDKWAEGLLTFYELERFRRLANGFRAVLELPPIKEVGGDAE